MQGVGEVGDPEAEQEKGDGGGDDPERGQQAAQAEAERAGLIAAQEGGYGDPDKGRPVEGALLGAGRPDDGEDEAVADEELGEVEDAGRSG
jgi:hypothetical protein